MPERSRRNGCSSSRLPRAASSVRASGTGSTEEPPRRSLNVEALNELLQSQEFTRRYGFRVLAAEAGTCDMLVPYLAENDRPGGIVSGQVYMHAADVAFWLAVKTLLGVTEEYVTSSMTSAFLGSARGHEFTCHARVLKNGRRLIYGEAECRSGERTLTHHTLTYVSVG